MASSSDAAEEKILRLSKELDALVEAVVTMFVKSKCESKEEAISCIATVMTNCFIDAVAMVYKEGSDFQARRVLDQVNRKIKDSIFNAKTKV